MPKHKSTFLETLRRGSGGDLVLQAQRCLNEHGWHLLTDGDFGPQTEHAVSVFKKHHGLPADGVLGPRAWAKLFGETEPHLTLGRQAWDAAGTQLGVMESGGNNSGVPLTRYIKPNGGAFPEAWCGDFVAWCYRRAGSKAPNRLWCRVSALSSQPYVVKVSLPRTGDLVRFTFDHVALFGYYCDEDGNRQSPDKATHIRTREGNTGEDGAVSDGNGEDGVYEKVRRRILVADYLRVTK